MISSDLKRSQAILQLELELGQELDPPGAPLLLRGRHLLAAKLVKALKLREQLLLGQALLALDVLGLSLVAPLEALDVAARGGGLAALDLDDLDREDEHVAAADLGRSAAVAVGLASVRVRVRVRVRVSVKVRVSVRVRARAMARVRVFPISNHAY